MIARFRRNRRLPMCLCGISLGLAVLYLCVHNVRGQIPPPSGGGDPTVQFSASNYYVGEGDTATMTVTLSVSSTQTVTVNYATSDGTGEAGVDYTATNGTLTFSPGTTSQNFNVSTLNNPNNTTYVTVNLTLSSPSNAMLGNPSAATLNVAGVTACVPPPP